jgi:hypothetical protein
MAAAGSSSSSSDWTAAVTTTVVAEATSVAALQRVVQQQHTHLTAVATERGGACQATHGQRMQPQGWCGLLSCTACFVASSCSSSMAPCDACTTTSSQYAAIAAAAACVAPLSARRLCDVCAEPEAWHVPVPVWPVRVDAHDPAGHLCALLLLCEQHL